MSNYLIKDITLLTTEDIFGENTLEVLKKYGSGAAVTDLAILTGAMYNTSGLFRVLHDRTLSGRTGCYVTKSLYEHGDAVMVGSNGDESWINHYGKYCSIRPVLKLRDFSTILANTYEFYAGINIVTFGEYPQLAAQKYMQKELEEKYQEGLLEKTDRTYTFDGNPNTAMPSSFEPVVYEEYTYNFKKYIRVKNNCNFDSVHHPLSNDQEYALGSYVWVEVSPVIWLVDEPSKSLISLRCLLSGIQFNQEEYDGYFSKTDMKKYLDKYMKYDLFKRTKLNEIDALGDDSKTKVTKRINPYNLNFGNPSEEEIIKGAIESGIAVFLHGPSSEGKSARVKQIDPTCEIIYLRSATPEYLNGKSVYNSNTGEMIDIPPTWLKKVEEKCQKEPNRLHVVFFDELTNAIPAIQGMTFNIILDREVNGIWKLPENARIVAAGNELSDSIAAYKMAEPLFNRFAHVRIKTTTDKWLKWASENNIHPAIYSFIAYTKGEALRSKFDGEKPNADPRKWEMASKMLYTTGRPEMLRSLVGEDITREFVEFCKQQVITLEDVLNDNYSDDVTDELNIAERYATIMTLSQVDEKNLVKVRDFVKGLGSEYVAVFDGLWAHGDKERFEVLQEVKLDEGAGFKVLKQTPII